MIIIALGGNLLSQWGDPPETLKQAIVFLGEAGVEAINISRFWQTEPLGVPDQQRPYVNAVISVETALDPYDLLKLCLEVEHKMGRERPFPRASKVIDLDLIAYHDGVIEEDELTVPHPRMHKRAFVLAPLCDIAPNWVHPVLGYTAADMLNNVRDQKVDVIDKDAA